jgi:hypothetical protein
MKIDEKRNLVIPVVTERVTRKADGKEVSEDVVKVWAYHSPIARELFETYFHLLAATKAALYNKGGSYLTLAGPRVAALTLRNEGKKDAQARGLFDEDGNVRDEDTQALFAELKRLTMILCPGSNGWDMLPVDTAISNGKIDAEDWEEVASSIVFFSCHYAMARKADRETTAKATASLLGASITSSAPMEFVGSSGTSTQAEATKTATFLIPS